MSELAAAGREGRKVFYGWYVVGATMMIMTVASGLGFYNLSVFLKAFVTRGGFPVSVVSSATAFFFIASGTCGIGVGRLIERIDVRWLMTLGAFICSAAMFASAYVSAVWHLYCFYTLFGIGYSCCGLIPGTTLVARWFNRQRSQALSIASTGLSLGGVILTPLSARLIEREGFGVAAPWLMAIFILGIVPVAWLAIRPNPQALGTGPDGDPLELDESGAPLPADGVAYQDAVKSRFFIFVTLAFICAMMAQVGAIAHQFNLVASRSNPETAALAVAVMATMSVIGRLVGGWILAHISSRGFVYALAAGQGGALLLYAFAKGPAMIVVAALFGLTVGNLLMMQALLLAEAFGLRSYGRIYSLNQLFSVAGVAGGPAVMGLLYARTGSYQSSYAAMAAVSFLTIVLVAVAGSVHAPAGRLEERATGAELGETS